MRFKTAYGLEWGQEVKLIREEEKEKSSSCDTQSGAKTVVLGKSGGLSWGQEDSPITSQNVGRDFTPLSSWCGTRQAEGATKGWPERINLKELSLPSSPRCDAAEALKGQFFSLILFAEISAF